MFSFKAKAQQAGRYAGISIHPHAIAMTVVQRAEDGELQLDYLNYRSYANAEQVPGELKIMLAEANARNLPTVLVLDRSHYSLLQLETPEVSEDELSNAVKWRIKDLIDFPLDDAVLELVPLPGSKRPGMPKMMYVVAARRSVIQQQVNYFDLLDQPILAIDIPEMALRNLTYADVEENRASALLYLSGRQSLINICREGSLYLSRHIMLDFDSVAMQDERARNDLLDLLSLEVQRSLDYYESHFADGAATKINMVSATDVSNRQFIEVAGSYLIQPVLELSALEKIKGIKKHSHKTVADCLPALGGAIRELVWHV